MMMASDCSRRLARRSCSRAGDVLRVIDPSGEQVADLVAFSRRRPAGVALVGADLRLQRHRLSDDRSRAVFESERADADDHGRYGRAARFPLHALQCRDVHADLQDHRSPSELSRQSGDQPRRHTASPPTTFRRRSISS